MQATARRHASACLTAALLVGCASGPSSQRDGPPDNPPPGLENLPDAEPRIEPLRVGGPNKPYVVLGQAYTPIATDSPLIESGLASWYGRKFQGQPTASGEIFDMYAMTAAHRTMPIPSYALVRNPKNGRQIVVRINDRGPFHGGRIIDLSYAAAAKLGVLHGVAPVQVQRLTFDDIRSGDWRQGRQTTAVAADAAPAAPADAAAGDPAPVSPPPADVPVDDLVAATPAAAGYWLQLGAFRERQGAFEQRRSLRQQFDWLGPLLAVFSDSAWYRVQAGPYASREQAQRAADVLNELASLPALIVRKR